MANVVPGSHRLERHGWITMLGRAAVICQLFEAHCRFLFRIADLATGFMDGRYLDLDDANQLQILARLRNCRRLVTASSMGFLRRNPHTRLGRRVEGATRETPDAAARGAAGKYLQLSKFIDLSDKSCIV